MSATRELTKTEHFLVSQHNTVESFNNFNRFREKEESRASSVLSRIPGRARNKEVDWLKRCLALAEDFKNKNVMLSDRQLQILTDNAATLTDRLLTDEIAFPVAGSVIVETCSTIVSCTGKQGKALNEDELVQQLWTLYHGEKHEKNAEPQKEEGSLSEGISLTQLFGQFGAQFFGSSAERIPKNAYVTAENEAGKKIREAGIGALTQQLNTLRKAQMIAKRHHADSSANNEEISALEKDLATLQDEYRTILKENPSLRKLIEKESKQFKEEDGEFSPELRALNKIAQDRGISVLLPRSKQ